MQEKEINDIKDQYLKLEAEHQAILCQVMFEMIFIEPRERGRDRGHEGAEGANAQAAEPAEGGDREAEEGDRRPER